MKCKVVAVVNQKGGVGKTTTAYTMAYQLSKMGKKVLLVDSDSQGNATQNAGPISTEIVDNSLPVLMMEALKDIDQDEHIIINPDKHLIEKSDSFHILPSNVTLSSVEMTMVEMRKDNPKVVLTMRRILDNYKEEYDYILIDCLPSVLMLVQNALYAADSVLIPVTPEYFAVQGFQLVLKSISLVRKINKNLKIEGVVLTMCTDRFNASKEMLNILHGVFGEHVKIYKNTISRSVAVMDAQSKGKCIIEYKRWHKVSRQYINLTKEFLLHSEGK